MIYNVFTTKGGGKVKNDSIYIRLDAELKDKIKKRAERESRTVTSYIIHLVKKDLEKQK